MVLCLFLVHILGLMHGLFWIKENILALYSSICLPFLEYTAVYIWHIYWKATKKKGYVSGFVK